MRVITTTILLVCALIVGCNEKELTDTSRSVSEADWAVQPMRELIGTHYDERLLNFVTMSDPETLSPGDLTIAGYAHYMGYGVPRDVARGLQLVRTSCEQGHLRGCALQGYFSAHSESYETRLESADVLTPTCDAGTFWACSTLVTVHAYGVGVDVDLDKAVMYANKSCEHPAERLCADAATTLKEFVPTESLRLHEKACDADNSVACLNLAVAYNNGRFGEIDQVTIKNLFDKSCQLGLGNACWVYLSYFNSGEAEQDDPTYYIESSDRVCRLGLTKACSSLASFFAAMGKNQAYKNEARAYEYAELACEQGDINVCLWLGEWARDGVGTEPDREVAMQAFQKACQSGDQWYATKACPSLAALEALETSTESSADLPSRACELGSAQDCREVAWMYATGEQVAADPERAIEYFKAACELGDAMSCLDIAGLHHWAEFGVEKDLDVALVYYKRSCSLEFEFACEKLAEFYESAG